MFWEKWCWVSFLLTLGNELIQSLFSKLKKRFILVKNQHVVPQCYLKNFENKCGKVFAYNLKANICIQKKVENVCYHKYTYES